MIFDVIVTTGRTTICKAVLLLTAILNIPFDALVFSRLPGLKILQIDFNETY